MMRFSKSSQFYIEEYYSEIFLQLVDAVFQIGDPVFNSASLRCSFYTQSCGLLPISLIAKCSFLFSTTYFSSLLLPPSQHFWDVLLPSNSKCLSFFLKMVHFLNLNIWYVFYVLFWMKYGFMRFANHCILFLFTFYKVSQLFWNWACRSVAHAEYRGQKNGIM